MYLIPVTHFLDDVPTSDVSKSVTSFTSLSINSDTAFRFRISDFRSQDSGEQISRLYFIKFNRFPRTPCPGRHSKGRDTPRQTHSIDIRTWSPRTERRHDDDGGGARHDGGGLLVVRRRFGHHSHHVLRSVGLLSCYGGIGAGLGRQLWFRC